MATRTMAEREGALREIAGCRSSQANAPVAGAPSRAAKKEETVNHLRATITEVPTGGWALDWNSGAHTHHATAAEAFNAVKRTAEDFAAAGVSTVMHLEWTTISRVGRMVAKAITG